MLTRRGFVGLLGGAAGAVMVPGALLPPLRRIWQVPANAPVPGLRPYFRRIATREADERIAVLLRLDAFYQRLTPALRGEVAPPREWVPGVWVGTRQADYYAQALAGR